MSHLLIAWNVLPSTRYPPRSNRTCGRISTISKPIKSSVRSQKTVCLQQMDRRQISSDLHQTLAAVPPICNRAGPNSPHIFGCAPPIMVLQHLCMLPVLSPPVEPVLLYVLK